MKRHSRPAFSLAEMMIALAILGFGLVVIGAALPVGLQYNRQSVDEANGDAVATYALEEMQRILHTRPGPPAPGGGQLTRPAAIFESRLSDQADPNFLRAITKPIGPVVKVRPVLTRNMWMTPGAQRTLVSPDPAVDTALWSPELRVIDFVTARMPVLRGTGLLPVNLFEEVDGGPLVRPSFTATTQMFPPVHHPDPNATSGRYDPQASFFANGATMYRPRHLETSNPKTAFVLEQAESRRYAWVGFYRRLSYAATADPNLYELIAIAVRRPSANHRFPLQAANGAYAARDTLTPVPWLVSFEQLPDLPLRADGQPLENDPSRTWERSVKTVTPVFRLPVAAGADRRADLFPVGALIIPALNDGLPFDGTLQGGNVGFAPHAPDALPIYRVVKRQIVGNQVLLQTTDEGLFPWVSPLVPAALRPTSFAVWVIPPAFEELDSANRPLFDNQSPVLGVARRVVRLPEVTE